MIAIKDFVMPKSCYDCPLVRVDADIHGIDIFGEECPFDSVSHAITDYSNEEGPYVSKEKYGDKRHESCPLIEI